MANHSNTLGQPKKTKMKLTGDYHPRYKNTHHSKSNRGQLMSSEAQGNTWLFQGMSWLGEALCTVHHRVFIQNFA
jgi:hypothetical protein